MTGPGSGESWWREVCARCGRAWDLSARLWRCRCGGLLDLVGPVVDPLAGLPAPPSGRYLQRYRPALPPGGAGVDLGAEVTPAVAVRPGVWVKADYEQPTGSFKDRGAAVMIGVAASLGVASVMIDSSGNAGRAVARCAARAGLDCTVYLPAGTGPAKVRAIAGSGASVIEVPGGRAAAAAAAVAAASAPGAPFYASHVHQPSFHHGVKTLAFELYEQVADLENGTVVVPAGNGTLVLGLWLGFGDLMASGRAGRRPAIVAVQADRCAPLLGPRPAGDGRAAPDPTSTAATGIAIPDPPRAAQIRGAAVASGGAVLAVSEDDIGAATAELHGLGFPVEATGAVAWAALPSLRSARPGGPGGGRPGPVVAVLTGRSSPG